MIGLNECSQVAAQYTPLTRRGVNVLLTVGITCLCAALPQVASACQRVRSVLYNMRVKVDVRDVAMHPEYGRELERRLPGAQVPQVFVNGIHHGVR